jgi:glucan phosphoethanolaminetransferase (alkaline phosphatase superfamily)
LPTRTGHPGHLLRWASAALAMVASGLAVVAVWIVAAVATDLACGWMALVAALDFAALLRLVRAPGRVARAVVAVAMTVLATAVAAWFIVAAQMGAVVGLDPLRSAARLGPVLAWEYTRLGFQPWDWACVAFAPLLAAAVAAGRRRGGEAG